MFRSSGVSFYEKQEMRQYICLEIEIIGNAKLYDTR